MQLGNAIAPIVAGSIVWRTSGDVPLAVATAACGVSGYLAAKAVKRLVRRGRPPVFLPDTHVREGDGSGFGFVSGHGAISAALAVTLGAALPPALRLLPAAGAALTGVGRIVYGMHLPADVVGGWGLGALLGLVGVAAVRR
jgi:undecaprenyl-diphosphatase